MDNQLLDTMVRIAEALRSAGYDPYAQLYGYLKTGNENYITRVGGARDHVRSINRNQLEWFVDLLYATREG